MNTPAQVLSTLTVMPMPEMLEYFPEPEEREQVTECDLCQQPLFHGDTVYKLMNKYICKECVEDAESEVE